MEVYTVIVTILAIVCYFLSYYFSVKAKIYAATEDAVNEAEKTDKKAGEKMEFAVNQIYALVPAAFKPFITKAVIERIVQKAFDKIEEYAKKQVEDRKGVESENLSKGN